MKIPIEQKLEEMLNVTRGANLQDLQELTKTFLSVIKTIKAEIEAVIEKNKGESNEEYEYIMAALGTTEINLKELITDSGKKSSSEVRTLEARIVSELERVESLIPDLPEMPDIASLETRINNKIDEVPAAVITKIEAELPQHGAKFRDGLETLKGDDRLDASAVKGIDEKNEKLSDTIINRAIGIVDQRTSFLIQKVSNLSTQIDNFQNDPELKIGDMIGNATQGSVFFAGVGGDLSQDNANFFWDDTNNRLGIGTATPAAPIEVKGTNNTKGIQITETASSGARGTFLDFVNANNGGSDPGGSIRFYTNTVNNTASIEALAGTTGASGNLLFKTNAGAGILERLRISTGGLVGIGVTTTPDAQLHVITPSTGLVLKLERTGTASMTWDFSGGTNNLTSTSLYKYSTVVTDAANKDWKVGVGHYTNSEEPAGAIFMQTTSAANTLAIGGGTSSFNAATTIVLYTASTNTVTTGTARITIDGDGLVGVGITPTARLHVDANAGASVLLAGTNFAGDALFQFTNSNTGGTSNVRTILSTASAAAGDPFLQFNISGVSNWSIGVDNSDSDKLEFTTQAGVGANIKMALDTSGNLGLGTTTFGTNATTTLALFNGTAPTTSPADMVQLFSADISAGNASLGIRTEAAVVSEAVVSDRTLSVTINGTVYKICLKA
jgi:hypothetical protein